MPKNKLKSSNYTINTLKYTKILLILIQNRIKKQKIALLYSKKLTLGKQWEDTILIEVYKYKRHRIVQQRLKSIMPYHT